MPAKKIDSTTLTCARPPGQVADQVARQADQPIGDAADVHQVRRQQEERHRQQDERVVRLERLVEQHQRRQPRLDDQDRQAGEARARTRSARAAPSARKNTPNRISAATAGDSTAPPLIGRAPRVAPRHSRLGAACALRPLRATRMSCAVGAELLAEEQEPGEAGERPGDEDERHRQLGELRVLAPAELHELDAVPEEHEREHQHEQRSRRSAAARWRAA